MYFWSRSMIWSFHSFDTILPKLEKVINYSLEFAKKKKKKKTHKLVHTIRKVNQIC
jgi:hypothetical protein